MNIKHKSKQQRDALQLGIYKIINPFVRLLIKCGFTPNMVTTIGFFGQVLAGAIIIWAACISRNGENVNYSMVLVSGLLVIGFSLFDMLDGQVARLGNMTTRFGAMYDSLLDRYCEFATLGGICFYLFKCNHLTGALLTFIALMGSIMVSYVRARAEGLGIECKMGFMQRPERVVLTMAALLATGITGCIVGNNGSFDPNFILIFAMGFLAFFANLTAIARINHCRRVMKEQDMASK
ncbi:MAG: CDP-alcohol phosphatidyltransferase family protein [Prevotella sp.]|nr:CDP-alcohol phosphatidyltransferase family protein [Prevotella sp.]MCM1075663.1 CDP-alcohol phosphatidyltransferase family protein [Ruminococcus sp.]